MFYNGRTVLTESINKKSFSWCHGFKTRKNNPFKPKNYLTSTVSSLNVFSFWAALLPVLFEMILFHFTIKLLLRLLAWHFDLYPFSFENIISYHYLNAKFIFFLPLINLVAKPFIINRPYILTFVMQSTILICTIITFFSDCTGKFVWGISADRAWEVNAMTGDNIADINWKKSYCCIYFLNLLKTY